ncbi:MAG: hypothetical protein FJX47_02005 [Alphaproteobacteria bacterium]|nr:hypothetical protein [Alphaproteobacteria bacterium]
MRALVLVLLLWPVLALAEAGVLGTAPGDPARQRALSAVPNAAAIVRRIWVPELDAGFTPQGLTFAEGELYLAGYVADRTPPARVFRLDPRDGRVLGAFDLPADIGHAGGLAQDGRGHLFVADYGKVYRLDLAAARDPMAPRLAVKSRAPMDREIGTAFAAFDGQRLWLGSHAKDGPGAIHAFNLADLFDRRGRVGLNFAARRLTIGPRAQGATFDRRGGLWITRNEGTRGDGVLERLDVASGRLVESWKVAGGIQDIAWAPVEGWVWASSEAGAGRWSGGRTHYPLLFAIDPARLR